MKKIKVMQQALDPTGYGGVSVEFRALSRSTLSEKYEFHPLILKNYHRGINYKDIIFYYKRIQIEKPDIVQIRGANIDGLNAIIATKLVKNVKSMYCIHGMVSDNVYMPKWKKLIFKWGIEFIGFWLADGISCVYQAGSGRRNFKVFQKKMLPFVYNRMPKYTAVDVAAERTKYRKESNIKPDDIVGIFCGRMTREKGLDYYADAINILQSSWPQKLKLLMVGDGDYLETFKRKISPDIVNNIVFAGSTNDVIPALAASDFFVLPSLHENHSIALLEALAMNLPCIATEVGGNPETLSNGRFGILIRPFDAKRLSESIKEMAQISVREKYKKEIKSFDFDLFSDKSVDEQLAKAYCVLLESNK